MAIHYMTFQCITQLEKGVSIQQDSKLFVVKLVGEFVGISEAKIQRFESVNHFSWQGQYGTLCMLTRILKPYRPRLLSVPARPK